MAKLQNSSGAILVLKDGRIVLQRRGSDAPTAANKLCTFGGHFREKESAKSAFDRELHEETSLPNLPRAYLGRYVLPKTGSRAEHHVYVYKVHLHTDSPEFKVFEGTGAEAYKLDELLGRVDLEPDTRHILESLKKEHRWL